MDTVVNSDSADMNKQPIISVRGSKVGLGPFTFEHFGLFLKAIQDPEISVYGSNTFDVFAPIPDMEDYKRRLKDESRFAIFELENLSYIGQCGLRSPDYRSGTGTLGITIGRKEFWGKGYGTEAVRLVVDYGFRFMNLQNVMLRTASFNERGQGAYKRAGFKEMGRRRNAIFIDGKRYDEIYMDCIPSEFVSPVPGWTMPF